MRPIREYQDKPKDPKSHDFTPRRTLPTNDFRKKYRVERLSMRFSKEVTYSVCQKALLKKSSARVEQARFQTLILPISIRNFETSHFT